MTTSRQVVRRLLEADPAEDAFVFSEHLDSSDIQVTDYDEAGEYKETTAELDVVWQADVEVRDWGIKGITPIIKSVTGYVSITDPDTDEELARIPVSFPTPASPQHLQQVMGAVPKPEASVKDWAGYYGPAQQEWVVELNQTPDPLESYALHISDATISVSERRIVIEF